METPEIRSSPPVIDGAKPPGSPPIAPQIGGRPAASRGAITALIILCLLGLLLAGTVYGVTGYFRINSDSAALRNSVMGTLPGAWNKKVALSVGWFTTGLVRAGSRFFSLPPEPRAALDSLRGASVAVYQLENEPPRSSLQTLLTAADRTMRARGWERVVGVAKEHDFVGVYFPHKKFTARNLRCCVLVMQGRELVVVSAAGNLEPLLKLAENHVDMNDVRRQLSFMR